MTAASVLLIFIFLTIAVKVLPIKWSCTTAVRVLAIVLYDSCKITASSPLRQLREHWQ